MFWWRAASQASAAVPQGGRFMEGLKGKARGTWLSGPLFLSPSWCQLQRLSVQGAEGPLPWKPDQAKWISFGIFS